MSNYLQQIALRSSTAENSNESKTLSMTPVAGSFGEERLTQKGPHEGWGEVFEPLEGEQSLLPDNEQPDTPSITQEQSFNPLAAPPSYLEAQVQRRLSSAYALATFHETVKNTTPGIPFNKERTPLQTEERIPDMEPAAGEKPPTEKKQMPPEQRQHLTTTEQGRAERPDDLKKDLKALTPVLLNKANRRKSVIQPQATAPLPGVPAVRKAESKLVIGRITVEVVKPAIPPKERVVVRSYQAAPRTGYQQRNKLSFGLGQL